MADLIEQMIQEFEPSAEDAEILDGRHDSKFSQTVRNLVSHRNSPISMFSRGYANYHREDENIEITASGRSFLDQVPDV